MRRLSAFLALCAVLLAALSPVAAVAQVPARFEALAVSSTAVAITASTYANAGWNASFCILTLAGDQVRWRVDGVNPTAAVGHIMDVGSELRLYRLNDIRFIRFIRVTGDATLSITCE